MANDFSTGKSVFVLAIVAGCFAILWPNVFYPMIQGSLTPNDIISSTQGCCDVMFDSDVNAIKVMTEICEKILIRQSDFDSKLVFAFQQGKITKEIVNRCQKTVVDTCGVDITQFLIEKVRLGRTYKQILDEIRSHNSSLCLKQSFGVSLGEIGLPRTIRIWGLNKPKHLRQERPPHLRPEFLHPALREKGRAIPHSHIVPKVTTQDGHKSSSPGSGIRPPMGGAGQVVPPPKGGGTMGIVMPMYTIGIIVFFLYTMMKLLFKKSDPCEAYDTFVMDPDFQNSVLKENSYSEIQDLPDDGTKLGDSELDFLKQRLQETEKAMERIVAKMTSLPNYSHPPEEGENATENDLEEKRLKENEFEKILHENGSEIHFSDNTQWEDKSDEEEIKEDTADGKSVVKVLGMEMSESLEHGAKWSRPATPLSRPPTPQNIFISGSLPSKSQILVSDSHIETIPAPDNSVVLTGKVTLSLIGFTDNNSETSDKIEVGSDEVLERNGSCLKSSAPEEKWDKLPSQMECEVITIGAHDDSNEEDSE